jgi:Domain of unknown function (DUF4337)
MESHDALRRFEKTREAAEGSHRPDMRLARPAAVVVAVLGGLLAIAAFLSNQAIKNVITSETRGAETTAHLEVNDLKAIVASNDALVLRVVGAGNPKEAAAAARSMALERRVRSDLRPVVRRLSLKVAVDNAGRDQADEQHLRYELSVVCLQVAIVLAGISILAARRWLLVSGGALGAADVALLIAGFAY